MSKPPEAKIELIAKTWHQPPRQCRTHFDRAKLLQLADSIAANGLFNPVECLPSGEIVSGHRRYLAAMLKDSITHLLTRIITDPMDAREIRIRRLSENLQRAELRFYDRYLECNGFIEDEPGVSLKEIAEFINVDASSVTRYLCLNRCIEEVKLAARAGLVGVKACYEISGLPKAGQLARLEKYLGRKPAGTVPAVSDAPGNRKPGRLRMPLPSGFTLVLGNEAGEMTVKSAIRELNSALEMLKEAEKENLGLKAITAVCESKAAARRPKVAAEASGAA